MTDIITYVSGGETVVITPSPDYEGSLVDLAAALVPNGVFYNIAPERPSRDHVFQNGAWVYVAPPIAVPASTKRWKITRALERIVLDLSVPAVPTWHDADPNNPADDARSYPVVKAAIDAQDGDAATEWATMFVFYRDSADPDYWPYLWEGIRSLMPDDTYADNFTDFLFNKTLSI